ncbi:hypothetical protein NQ318_006797 [Aromia moschata]|uniref:Uncharacterized protein n=1 Tax=Aromia moschata TaxID=1265417 RepID=A0AAV8XTB3_9CUCU|nr:hypothetical protein NQ318_006797 [Aromia moschata]
MISGIHRVVPFAVGGVAARRSPVVVRALVDAVLLGLVVRVRVRVGRQPARGLPVAAVDEARVPVRLVGALAARRGGLLTVVAVRLRLRHPDVLGAAGAHVARVVLQLPDEVLQVPDADRAARRHVVLVLVLVFYHHLRVQITYLIKTSTFPILSSLDKPITITGQLTGWNVLLAAGPLVVRVALGALRETPAQQLLAERPAAARRRRRAAVRRGVAQRLDDVLVVAVERLERALDVGGAAARRRAADQLRHARLRLAEDVVRLRAVAHHHAVVGLLQDALLLGQLQVVVLQVDERDRLLLACGGFPRRIVYFKEYTCYRISNQLDTTRCERVVTSLNRTVSGDTFPILISLDKPWDVKRPKTIRAPDGSQRQNRTITLKKLGKAAKIIV